MSAVELKPIREAISQIEKALKTVEDYLENHNNRDFYNASLCLVDALKHFHATDLKLLNTENDERITDLLIKLKQKSGRDSFNTGF